MFPLQRDAAAISINFYPFPHNHSESRHQQQLLTFVRTVYLRPGTGSLRSAMSSLAGSRPQARRSDTTQPRQPLHETPVRSTVFQSLLECVPESTWSVELARLCDELSTEEPCDLTGPLDQTEAAVSPRTQAEHSEPRSADLHSFTSETLESFLTKLNTSVKVLEDDWLCPVTELGDSLQVAAEAFQRLRANTARWFLGSAVPDQALGSAVRRLLRLYAIAKQAHGYFEHLGVLSEEADTLDRALAEGSIDLRSAWEIWERLHREKELLAEELAIECEFSTVSCSAPTNETESEREQLQTVLTQRCEKRIAARIQQACRWRLRDLVPSLEQHPEDIHVIVAIFKEEPQLLAPLFPDVIREAISRRADHHERSIVGAASEAERAADTGASERSPGAHWLREALADLDARNTSEQNASPERSAPSRAEEYGTAAAAVASKAQTSESASRLSLESVSREPEEPQFVARMLQRCELLIEDIRIVQKHVAALGEPAFPLDRWYALETNQIMNAVFWGIITRASLIPSRDILDLLGWIHRYRDFLQQTFPMLDPEGSASPAGALVWDRTHQETLVRGLDMPAERLIEGYAARALEMMRRWIRNCIKVDTEGPVDVRDDDGSLYTQGPLDVFRIVNDEMTIVQERLELGNPRFVQCISDACCAALLDYRTWSLDALEGTESEDGALERFCATVNNHRRCESLAAQFATRCHTILNQAVYGLGDWERETSATPQTPTQVPGPSPGTACARESEALNETTYVLAVDNLAAQFAVSAEFAATRVCNVIFEDMDDAPGLWPRLYTPAWISGEEEIANSIVATVDDFFHDIDTYLRVEVDRALVGSECATRVADRYAAALASYLGATGAAPEAGDAQRASPEALDPAGATPPLLGPRSRDRIAQRIAGGSSSRLLQVRAAGSEDARQGRRFRDAHPVANLDRRMVERLRKDYGILAAHFLHARRGGSHARVVRALAAIDAIADMLAAAFANNADAVSVHFSHLLDARLSRHTLYLWQPSTVERLLVAVAEATERTNALDTWKEAVAACRRAWSAREQRDWGEQPVSS